LRVFNVRDRRPTPPARGRGRPSYLLTGVLALVCLLSVAVLLAFSGGFARLFAAPLLVELRYNFFALPKTTQLDPDRISAYLTGILQKRAREDTALRVMLGSNVPQQVADRVVPRLLNPAVIRIMIRNTEALAALTQADAYRALVTGVVTNTGSDALEDVAVTIPNVLYVETDGRPVEIREAGGFAVLRFGTLEGGQSVPFRAWMGEPPSSRAALRSLLRAGSAGGVNGTVILEGIPDWFGAHLEAAPWAGWLVAGFFLLLAVLSAFGAITLFIQSIRRV